MTVILITALTSVILAFVFYKQIHQYKFVLYVIAAVIGIAIHDDANIITLGYVPLAMFLVVMYSGVLNKGKLRKRLFMVRAEYAILATILLLPHGLGYLLYFLDEIDFKNWGISFFVGFVTLLFIVPLFITSFQSIRKKMKYKQWKSLHRTAYIVYTLIFAHLLLLQNERFYIYLSIYGLYVLFKIPDLVKDYNKKKSKLKEAKN